MTADLSTFEAQVELGRLQARVRELQLFLRQRTPSGLTRGERTVAAAFVQAGSVELAAARLGMRHVDVRTRLASVCRKLGVDEADLGAVLGVVDGVL